MRVQFFSEHIILPCSLYVCQILPSHFLFLQNTSNLLLWTFPIRASNYSAVCTCTIGQIWQICVFYIWHIEKTGRLWLVWIVRLTEYSFGKNRGWLYGLRPGWIAGRYMVGCSITWLLSSSLYVNFEQIANCEVIVLSIVRRFWDGSNISQVLCCWIRISPTLSGETFVRVYQLWQELCLSSRFW